MSTFHEVRWNSAIKVIDITSDDMGFIIKGEPILIIETDKATMEVVSPASGKLKLLVNSGRKYDSDELLAVVESDIADDIDFDGFFTEGNRFPHQIDSGKMLPKEQALRGCIRRILAALSEINVDMPSDEINKMDDHINSLVSDMQNKLAEYQRFREERAISFHDTIHDFDPLIVEMQDILLKYSDEPESTLRTRASGLFSLKKDDMERDSRDALDKIKRNSATAISNEAERFSAFRRNVSEYISRKKEAAVISDKLRAQAEQTALLQQEKERRAANDYNKGVMARLFAIDKYNQDHWEDAFSLYSEIMFDKTDHVLPEVRREVADAVGEIKKIRDDLGRKRFAAKSSSEDRKRTIADIRELTGVDDLEDTIARFRGISKHDT